MKIYLVRHGETDWNTKGQIQGQTDIGLNEAGRRQARELGAMLQEKNLRVAAVYSSPLKRAVETAGIVSKKLELPSYIFPGLQEICFGKWEGLTWDEVKTNDPEYYQDWYTNRRYQRTPDGESYQDMLERVISALRRIIETEAADVIIICHSAVIMALRCFLNDDSFTDMVKKYKVGNAGIVELSAEDIMKKDVGQML